MGSAGVSVWAPTGILSFYSAASAPRHHRQLRWLNPISAEIAEPFPRLWRGDCLADWGQTIAGCPGRLRAAHSSRSAQIPKPSQWEVNQLLTVFHKQFSSCFLNYKTIRFFFLYNNFTSITASKLQRPKGQLICSSSNTIVLFIHVSPLSEHPGTGFVVFNGLEFRDRKLIDYLPVFSLFS